MSHQFKPGDKVLVGPVKSDPCEEGETYVKAGAIGFVVDEGEVEGQIELKFDDASKVAQAGIDLCWFVDIDRLKLLPPENPDNQQDVTVPDQCTFTQRQRAAIDLRVPDSGTPWLDEMIRQSVRQELAGKALVGVTQGWFDNPGSTSACVEIANDLADALIARIGGAK